jgi:hypothetical protein
MSKTRQELSTDEIENQTAEELPEREEMSLANLNLAIPINAGIAANVLSDGATAAGTASQGTPIDQSNL